MHTASRLAFFLIKLPQCCLFGGFFFCNIDISIVVTIKIRFYIYAYTLCMVYLGFLFNLLSTSILMLPDKYIKYIILNVY